MSTTNDQTQTTSKLRRRLAPLNAPLHDWRRRHLLSAGYGALLCLLGLAWLSAVTDLPLMLAQWQELLLLLALALLNRFSFFWIVERPGGYNRWSAPLGGLVTTAAWLIFGCAPPARPRATSTI